MDGGASSEGVSIKVRIASVVKIKRRRMLSSSSLGAQLNCSSSSSSRPSSIFVIPSPKNSIKDSIFFKLNPFPFSKLNISRHATQPTSSSTNDDSSTPEPEKLGVVVKLMEKPNIVLKFIWVDRNLGLALDQVIPGHGSIPLGPYYFWPRKDAWDELKIMLESKPWLSQKQVDVLLNQATDIINMWQKSDGNQS